MGKLFWLASYPKSGNTWVRIFLAHWFHGAEVDINRLDEAGMSIKETWPEAWHGAIGFIPKKHEDQASVRAHVQRYIASQREGVSICKTHNACVSYKGYPLIDIESTGGALYIIRDPRDICLSMMRHSDIGEEEAVERINGFSTFTETADGIHEYVSDWSTHVNSWKWAPKVRYEDLWHDPFTYFDQILAAFCEETDMDRLGDAISQSDLARMRRVEDENGFNEAVNGKFFGKGGSTWRERLSRKSQEAIWAKHGETMWANGYRETPWLGQDCGSPALATTTGSIPASQGR